MSDTGISHSPAPRVVKIGRLDSLVRVRRELARLYGEARRGQIDALEASRLGNILAVMGRLIEGGELELRVAELEAAAEVRDA